MSNSANINSNSSNLQTAKSTKWALSVRVFHWLGALLLLVTWLMILLHENSDGNTYIGLHKAFGFSLLCWTIARLINRLILDKPKQLLIPFWQKLVSSFTHFVLYILLLAMPLSGMLMSWFGGRPIDIFGLFEIPLLVTPDRSQARLFNDIHTDVILPALLVLIALHIAAALYHHFIKKDGVLKRML